jgi:lysophospholipase L1-like esterase
LVHLRDYQSPTFNIKQGIRDTPTGSERCDHGGRSIFICGGSTVICSEVTDLETLPSCVASALTSRRVKARVENWGRWGSTIANRAWYVESHIRPRPGDVVVLYFGANDSGFRQTRYELKPLRGLIDWMLVKAIQSFYVGMRALRRQKKKYDTSLLGVAILPLTLACRPLLTLLAWRVVRNNRKIVEVLSSSTIMAGVDLVLVLQPQLYEMCSRNGVRDRRLQRDMTLEVTMPVAYRRYRKWRSLQSNEDRLYFIDATTYLDEHLDSYLDWAHLDARGNAVVAKRLVDDLQRLGVV